MSRAVRESLMVRAADFGIVLEDIAITHLSFGTEFTKVGMWHCAGMHRFGYAMIWMFMDTSGAVTASV